MRDSKSRVGIYLTAMVHSVAFVRIRGVGGREVDREGRRVE